MKVLTFMRVLANHYPDTPVLFELVDANSLSHLTT